MLLNKEHIFSRWRRTVWYRSIAPQSRDCFSSNVKSVANFNRPKLAIGRLLNASVSVSISAHVLCNSRIWSFNCRSAKPTKKLSHCTVRRNHLIVKLPGICLAQPIIPTNSLSYRSLSIERVRCFEFSNAVLISRQSGSHCISASNIFISGIILRIKGHT